ncbi:tetratricopeptide repeat protein [Pseudoalteromonas piscicida]|uniref:Uncharacterized protein n=1 Tax=Pseudoalteromonas piscicida TaxID=43662 RepID=A0A2A5JU06_PSEO7|nr:tetratricopeptide repeat protein [Pseudoalteromonas piscicida]PCK32964.1 hypothetical protein CEX98_04170 [Pseudoalteromonas piscicida]
MKIVAFFLLVTTASTTFDFDAFKQLVKNKPAEAIEQYQREIVRPGLSVETQYDLHFAAIRASAMAFDNQVFSNAVKALQADEFQTLVEQNKVKLVSNIGVGYRLRDQNEQAILHYRCAMNASSNYHHKSALKVNIAIAYMRLGQPTVGYDLLIGIDSELLPSFMQAGLNTALGNALFTLGKYQEALTHYQRASAYHTKAGNGRGVWEVELNTLGVYILRQELMPYFDKLKALAQDKRFVAQTAHYMKWLALLAQRLEAEQRGKVFSTTEDMQALALGAAKEGYARIVNAHIDQFTLPLLHVSKFSANRAPLPDELAKPWCRSL